MAIGPPFGAPDTARNSASRRRCRRATFPNLQRPTRSPPLPPEVAENNRGPQTHTRLEMRVSHQSSNRGNRRRGIPPPGAGVRWQRPPIRTDRRSPLTTASSRGGTNALKRNRGWRREFRISQRFNVSDATVSWPEWGQRPTETEAHRARIRGGCLLSNSRRERVISLSHFGEVCRNAPPGANRLSPAAVKSEEGRAMIARRRAGGASN